MRRIFSILICFVFSISFLSFTVSADSSDYIDLVDFHTGSNSFSFTGDSYCSYDLPERMVVSYVDIIFSAYSSADLVVQVIDQNNNFRGNLTVLPIGGPYFRAYGSITSSYYTSLMLHFSSLISVSGSKRITIEKFITSPLSATWLPISGTISGFAMGQEVSSSWGTESQISSITFPTSNIDGAVFTATYWVPSTEALKFDFLNFSLAFDSLSIDSIVCETSGGLIIPFEQSFLSSSSYNLRVIDIKCDLRDMVRDRNLYQYIKIHVTGTLARDVVQHAYLYHAYGNTIISGSDPDIYWYQRLFNAITDGFDSLLSALGFNSSDPEFNDDAQEKVDDLDDLSSQLDAVSPPDISDVNFNVSGLVNPSVVTLTTSGISNILSNEIILRVLIISATFAVAGFILYGKK